MSMFLFTLKVFNLDFLRLKLRISSLFYIRFTQSGLIGP